MYKKVLSIAGLLTAMFAQLSFPQTQVDLRTQTKSVDFSAATSTRPLKTGTALPGTCTAGDMFFKTDATAGQNLYGCTATNTWSQQAGGTSSGGGTGGGATSFSQLTDFQVLKTGSAALSVGAACSTSAPCNARFGNSVFSITGGATITLANGTGTAYIYLTASGVLTVGHNVSLTCSNCAAQTGVVSFPADSLPIATWVANAGAWDANGFDFRSGISTKNVSAGTGLVSQDNLGLTTLSIDTASIGLRVSVPVTATGNCVSGSWAADASFLYVCFATNSWRRSAVSSW